MLIHSALKAQRHHFCRQFYGVGMATPIGPWRQTGCTKEAPETCHPGRPLRRIAWWDWGRDRDVGCPIPEEMTRQNERPTKKSSLVQYPTGKMATLGSGLPSKKKWKKFFNFFLARYQSTRFRVFSWYSSPSRRMVLEPRNGGILFVLLLVTWQSVIFVTEGCRRNLNGASGQTALWFDKSDSCPVFVPSSLGANGTERCKKLIYILFPAIPLLSWQESKRYEK